MTIELPDVKIGSQPLTSEQARVDFAVGLYSGRHASLGRAAKMAGLPVVRFMQELGRRGIYRSYSVADALHDVQWVREKLGQ
jgi:predicted HTH domain antitoxin